MKIEISFTKERETPGTIRYKEDGHKDDAKVGTLYVKKAAFEDGYPNTLRVTIEG